MDGGAWLAAVHGVAKSWTRLSDFTFTFHFHALEKEMVIHSSVLAWRIPGTGEPGGLQSMGSHKLRHNGAAKHNIPFEPSTRLLFEGWFRKWRPALRSGSIIANEVYLRCNYC